MPRPRKPRYCGCDLCGHAFRPTGIPMSSLDRIALASDELETLRLCDLEGLTQAEAGERMGVSRGTVQRTVKEARRKVARALVEGAVLVMEDILQDPQDIKVCNGPGVSAGQGKGCGRLS